MEKSSKTFEKSPITSNTSSFNFSAVEIPILKETPSRKNYYQTNASDTFFEELIHFYSSANVHASFVNNLKDRIIGTGMIPSDPASQLIMDKYDFNNIFKKIAFDYTLYGGFALEIIWDVLHTRINKVNYLDFSKIRPGFIDEKEDKVTLYYYSCDWHRWQKEIEVFHTFDVNKDTDAHQIYYYKDFYPGSGDVFPRPFYYAGLKWCYVEVEEARYYSNLIKNNFTPTTLLTVNSFFDDEKQLNFEKSLKQFTGGEAAGTIFVIYNEGGDATTKPEILKFNSESEDQKYSWLSQHCVEELIIAHRIPNPLIAGVKTPGQLGGATELEVSEKQYNLQIVIPRRNNIMGVINDINKYIPGDFNYEVKNIDIFTVADETIQ